MSISKKKMRKSNKRVRPSMQQRFAMYVGRIYARITLRRRYGFSCAPVTVGEPFILVANHTTDMDLLFSLLSVPHFMYYVLSEHLQRRSLFMKWAVKRMKLVSVFKGSVAGFSARNIIRLVRDGNNVCLFPEGGHSLDGRTNPFSSSTGRLIKSAGCALVTLRTHGGYFLKPRWAKNWRRGPVRTEGAKVYTSAELADRSPEEINALIARDIYVDAYAEQKEKLMAYPGEKLAEGLENIFYICPVCGALETIKTEGNQFSCTQCGSRGSLDEYGYLSGNFPYKTVAEWSDWERREVARRFESGDVKSRAENVRFLEITQDHKEHTLVTGHVSADCQAISISGSGNAHYRFPYTEIEAMEYIDQCNTLLFSFDGHYYSLEAAYLDGALIRRLYILCSSNHANQNGKRFDEAK